MADCRAQENMLEEGQRYEGLCMTAWEPGNGGVISDQLK